MPIVLDDFHIYPENPWEYRVAALNLHGLDRRLSKVIYRHLSVIDHELQGIPEDQPDQGVLTQVSICFEHFQEEL